MKDRLGHDRRYAIDSAKAQAQAGLGAAPPLRGGAGRDGALVRREPPLVGADHLRRVPQVLREAVRGRGSEGRGHRRQRPAGRRGGGPAGRPPRGAGPRARPLPARRRAATAGSRPTSATAAPWRRRCSPSGAQAVLHAGAVTDVDGCEREPGAGLAGQRGRHRSRWPGPAARSGARLVAVSTDYVFDGEAGPYGEEDLPNPRGVYARTKLAARRRRCCSPPTARWPGWRWSTAAGPRPGPPSRPRWWRSSPAASR